MRLALITAGLLTACGGDTGLCMFGGIGLTPDGDAEQVPTNARVTAAEQLAENWEGSNLEDSGIDLVDSDGVIVPIELDAQRNDDQRFYTLTPTAPLRPATTYSLLSGSIITRSFTTGDGPDTEPPPAPVVLSSERHRTGLRGSRSDEVELVIEGLGEDVFIEVTVTDVSSGEQGVAWGFVRADREQRSVWVGEGVCNDSVPLRGAVDLVVRAIDIAGNVSEPTAAIRH